MAAARTWARATTSSCTGSESFNIIYLSCASNSILLEAGGARILLCRGEMAFCSHECRYRVMLLLDEEGESC
jgi:hypothetical protein